METYVKKSVVIQFNNLYTIGHHEIHIACIKYRQKILADLPC